MKNLRRKPTTKEEVIQEAKSFNSIKEIRKIKPNLYNIILKRGWLDEIKKLFENDDDLLEFCFA